MRSLDNSGRAVFEECPLSCFTLQDHKAFFFFFPLSFQVMEELRDFIFRQKSPPHFASPPSLPAIRLHGCHNKLPFRCC